MYGQRSYNLYIHAHLVSSKFLPLTSERRNLECVENGLAMVETDALSSVRPDYSIGIDSVLPQSASAQFLSEAESRTVEPDILTLKAVG